MKTELIPEEEFEGIVESAEFGGCLGLAITFLDADLNDTFNVPTKATYQVASNYYGYAVMRLENGVPVAFIEKERWYD